MDSDGDGLINALDPDSDNDGLFDGTEMGLDCKNPATNLAKTRLLLDRGAEVKAKGKRGATPMIVYCDGPTLIDLPITLRAPANSDCQ